MKRALASILLVLAAFAPGAHAQAAARHLGEVYFEEAFEADIPEGQFQTYKSQLVNTASLAEAKGIEFHMQLSNHYQTIPKASRVSLVLHDKTRANFVHITLYKPETGNRYEAQFSVIRQDGRGQRPVLYLSPWKIGDEIDLRLTFSEQNNVIVGMEGLTHLLRPEFEPDGVMILVQGVKGSFRLGLQE